MTLKSGWNLPPGVFERELPGYNDVECSYCDSTYDSRYGCDCPEAHEARVEAEAAKLDAALDAQDDWRYNDY